MVVPGTRVIGQEKWNVRSPLNPVVAGAHMNARDGWTSASPVPGRDALKLDIRLKAGSARKANDRHLGC
jgi:hypothetical protein